MAKFEIVIEKPDGERMEMGIYAKCLGGAWDQAEEIAREESGWVEELKQVYA